LWGPSYLKTGIDPRYLRWLQDRGVDTAIAAFSNMRPVSMRAATVKAPPVVRNSRDGDILEDELVALQCLDASSGSPLATMINFAWHPEALWSGNQEIISDYVHYLRQEIEARIGGPALFFPGALGGLQTPQVATAALDALDSAQTEDLPRVRHEMREFVVPMANPLFRLAILLRVMPSPLGALRQIRTEANLVQLGPLWMLTVPGELLPAAGLKIKQ
jgi:hypothetical protein